MNDPADETLASLVVDALRDVLEEYRKEFSNLGGLAALGLCTDDDLMSLVCYAAPVAWFHDSVNVDATFWPPDWPFERPIDAASHVLRARYDHASAAGTYSKHVDRSFESLVVAVERVRAEMKAVANCELLMISSTDPGPGLMERCERAMRRLNAPHTVERWRTAWGIDAP